MMAESTITDERITSVIERLEHYACNLKWTNVRGAQDLLTAADGLRELQERRKADSELVEAKDKADMYDMLQDDYGLREKGVGLADFVDWQAKRIAEMESRTVKLPPTFWYEHDDLSRDVPVLDKRLVKKMLREAGIKVEAE
jgi:hypothetical protein